MEWLMTPVNFTAVTHFNPEIYKVDQEAKLYLQHTPLHILNMIPIDVTGNGNCLYNPIIRVTGSTALTSSELRGKHLQH